MIQVVHRAFNILELLARNPQKEIGLSEIADVVELNHGTCANILKTLSVRGYVEQMGPKRGYKLGYMAYQLTNADSYHLDAKEIAGRYMRELQKKINETVILSVIRNNKRILLDEVLCDHEIQVKTTNESSVYRATTGRVLLAYYSPKDLSDFVASEGLPTEEDWPEVTSKDDLIDKLNVIRKNGIEISYTKNHVVGLGTPIFKGNIAVASLGVYLPDLRFGKKEKTFIVKSLLEATESINRELNK